MPDYHFGDNVSGGIQYKQTGSGNFTVNNAGVSRDELYAAVTELRAFIAQLTSEGIVSPDGSVKDPGAVVAAVKSKPGHLRALGDAIAGGAKDAVLSIVKGGVASLIVALAGG